MPLYCIHCVFSCQGGWRWWFRGTRLPGIGVDLTDEEVREQVTRLLRFYYLVTRLPEVPRPT